MACWMLMIPILVGGATEGDAADVAAALPSWAKAVIERTTAATSESLVTLHFMIIVGTPWSEREIPGNLFRGRTQSADDGIVSGCGFRHYRFGAVSASNQSFLQIAI